MLVAAAAALCLALLAILVVDSHSSVTDVHVPEQHLAVLRGYGGTLPAGQPYVVDRGVGPVGRTVAWVLQSASIVAIGLLIWSLVTRRKGIAYAAAAWLLLAYCTGPIPSMMQPVPPVAVSVDVARAALHVTGPANVAWAKDPANWRRYMLAQIAFAEGKTSIAAKLATDLRPGDLGAPIEALYRLSFFDPASAAEMSPWCRTGCLSPVARTAGATVMISTAVLSLAASLVLAFAFGAMRRRLSVIDTLATTGRRRRMTA